MVVGLDRWRSHFADFADRYVLVGGVACEQVMGEVGLDFRATKDFDVVLLVELLDASFADAFWAFIEAGGYERREKAEGGKLYRFQRPTSPDFPQMIELFSRAPDGFELAPGSVLTPLPIEDAAASLSAILLDAGYYAFLLANARVLDGLPLLGEAGLIPFKARAYLDLSARKAEGADIDDKNIKKHRNDVFRVLQLLPEDAVQPLPDAIKADMSAFLDAVGRDETFTPADFKIKLAPAEALSRLASAFGL
ncbi:MAG: hypothetical protein WA047_07035 [Phenylobacterium sp.]|uniref:hypothetical protein n=1 Tax=Phenylobacterium sp. TaxID=1871053 RepID=UPI003BB51D91